MTLRVSGKNMDIGESLRTRAEGHFDEMVKKYFDGNYSGHMTLSPEGFGYAAHAIVHLDTGVVLEGNGSGTDPTLSYEQMVNAIEKRLRRYNRKLRSHRRGAVIGAESDAIAYVLQAPEDDEELHEDYAPPVIAESPASLRQMSVGEAVMQLDLTEAEVVVFRHAGHGGLNVVYRRADGNIGWIDPSLKSA
jgi:ribosomal subunit interface protein